MARSLLEQLDQARVAPPPAPRRRRFFMLLLAVLVTPLLLIGWVQLATLPYRAALDRVADAPVALVFGAGVRPDGTPSPMLADRVEAAVALYQAGTVERLLMSGDNSQAHYNEVGAMRAYAQRHGVPDEAILLDSAGLSTYESCYRARSVFGVRQAILVTQDFHLPRAIYTCRQLGIAAVGVGTPDWGAYSDEVVRWYTVREWLATLNALVEVHLTRPEPRISGPYPGWDDT